MGAGYIQLTNGKWEGAPSDGVGSTFSAVRLSEFVVAPGSGTSAAVVLAGGGGGSGTFHQLQVLDRELNEATK